MFSRRLPGETIDLRSRPDVNDSPQISPARLSEAEPASLEILDAISDEVHVLDRDGRHRFFNAAARRRLVEDGLDPEMLIGRRPDDTTSPPAVSREARAAMSRARAQGATVHVDAFNSTRQGWESVRVHPVPDGGLAVFIHALAGPPVGRGGEARLAGLFNQAAVGLAEIAPTGQFVRVNDHFCELLGRLRHDVLAANFAGSTDLEDVPRALRAVADVVATGVAASLDLRFIRRDDTTVWAHTTLTRLGANEGNPCSLLATVVDLTARRLAEERVRESEQRLRRATEIETVGIYFFRTTGAITDANDAFLQMTGYTREDLAAQRLRFHDLTPLEWLPATQTALTQLNALGNSIPYEKQFIRQDGTRWWGLFAGCRLSEHEGIEYVIDISDRKSAETELRRARDTLDLAVQERTAELEAAAGALRDEIIERQRTERERQALLQRLVTAQEEERRRISRELHDEIGQLVAALLLGLRSLPSVRGTAAAIEKLHNIGEQIGREVHGMALSLRPTALDDLGLLRTLSNYVDEWSQRAKIGVDFHSPSWKGERLPAHIETTIYRIVQEALTNVLKHARATRVGVIVERRDNHALVIVEDNGLGFDPVPVQEQVAGKRLGLIGMNERAALAGGELRIESSPGNGTTIFVRIPLAMNPTQSHDQITDSPR